MKKSNADYLFQAGFRALLLVAAADAAWAQMDMPALTYDVVYTRYEPEGDGIVTRETHAMRRDGSTVAITLVEAPDGTSYELRLIQDLAHGTSSQLNTAIHTVTSSPIQHSAVDLFLNGPGRRCGAPLDATPVTFGAYHGLRFSTTVDTTPGEDGGEVETVRLVAPQLGCASLLTVVREDGRVTGVRQMENIRRGEPDPGLFAVPAGYREASPDEVSRLAYEKFGSGDDHG